MVFCSWSSETIWCVSRVQSVVVNFKEELLLRSSSNASLSSDNASLYYGVAFIENGNVQTSWYNWKMVQQKSHKSKNLGACDDSVWFSCYIVDKS